MSDIQKKVQRNKDMGAIVKAIVEAERGGIPLAVSLLKVVTAIREEYDTRMEAACVRHRFMSRDMTIEHLRQGSVAFSDSILLDILDPEPKT